MPRPPIPTWYFALVVVRAGDKFLLVHEQKEGQLWYLPAGRVEPGETLIDAAVRETLEEAGVPVEIEGIIRLEHTPVFGEAARVRAVFLARPIGNTSPKNEPDEESLEARWVSLDELDAYPLRGEEVRHVFNYVASGGPVYPLSLLTWEGAPYPDSIPP